MNCCRLLLLFFSDANSFYRKKNREKTNFKLKNPKATCWSPNPTSMGLVGCYSIYYTIGDPKVVHYITL
ncbi:MAG: hypothetical protein LN566_07470 [Rickettsia endosymbiont of Stiretrus anchorago]|nr:hypothetical protein [Rickettsia endosymbiont of Stiretrus anchorago]